MSRATTPHDVEAERSLIGSMLTWPDRFSLVRPVISADDFWTPQLAAMWSVLDELALAGKLYTDMAATARELDAAGVLDKIGGVGALIEFQVAASASPVVVAEGLVRLRALRDLQALGLAAARDAVLPGASPDEIKHSVMASASLVGTGTRPVLPRSVLELLEDESVTENDWVLPHLLRRTHRAMIVAGEGVGKSLVSRLIAACGAVGLDPFTRNRITPIKVLLIDLENPPDAVRRTFRELNRAIESYSASYPLDGDLSNAQIYSRLDRLNLRTSKGRAEIEQVIADVRPDLVIFGPLYKAMHVDPKEPYDLAATDVQSVIDDLRQRYNSAWIIEHHAPHNDRKRPFGSSAWLRWPELGLLLERDDMSASLSIGRWRGDRVDVTWPDRLDRDRSWIFEGYYRDGHPWSGTREQF